MADGRHLEFLFLAIISASIYIFSPNLVPIWKISGLCSPTGQKSNFGKSHMADSRHLEFRFWAIKKFDRRSTFLHQIQGRQRFGDGGMHPQHFDRGMHPDSLAILGVGAPRKGGERRHSSISHHSLEDRLLKLANTICYLNGPRALILPIDSIEKSLAAQFHS